MGLKKFINYIEKCYSIASDLKLELIFSIHQTSNFSNINPYTLPPRKSKKILLCGVCNLGQEEILELASLFKEKIDYFLVDLEKKGIICTNKKVIMYIIPTWNYTSTSITYSCYIWYTIPTIPISMITTFTTCVDYYKKQNIQKIQKKQKFVRFN